MSKKRKCDDDDQAKNNPDPAFQDKREVKRARLTSPTAKMLQDLPMELLEHILLEAIISEVRDRKILRGGWKEPAERVVERLRNVCQQWGDVLTTSSFQSRLHRIIDTYPQVEICLQVLAQRRFSKCITVATMNDEIFLLCHLPNQQAHIDIYARDDLWTVKSSIRLHGVSSPWDLVACSVSNCLYVLHQAINSDIEILHVTKEGQQFKVSHFITCSPQNVTRMCTSAGGSLIVFQDPSPNVLTTYNADGHLQHQVELEKPISCRFVVSKSNGNFVLITKNNLTEIGREGNILRKHNEPSAGHLYSAIDQYDRVVVVDEYGNVRLLDSEFNSVKVNFQLISNPSPYMHLYKIRYNRKRNEFVAFETAAFYHDDNASQCLTVFNFTERNVPNDAQNKQN